MAIVEAASCGLQVVSTRVGGIPEVLPSSLIILTEPNVESVLKGVLLAIERVISNRQLGKSNAKQNGGVHCNGGKLTIPMIPNGGHAALVNGKKKKKTAQKVPALKEKNRLSNDDSLEDRVLCPFECNEIVGHLYNWNNVTVRTEKVYRKVMTEPDPPFGYKLNCYLKACAPFLLVVSFSFLLLKLLDYLQPRKYIDLAREYNGINQTKRKLNTKETKI